MRVGSLGLLEPRSGVLESLLSDPAFLRLSPIPDGLKVLFMLRGPAVTVVSVLRDLSGVEAEILVKTAPGKSGLLLFPSCFGSLFPPSCSRGSLPLDNTPLTALWSCCLEVKSV